MLLDKRSLRLILLGCVIWFCFFVLLMVRAANQDWHDDFFKALESQPLKSYRLLQQLENKPSEKWVQGMTSFMSSLSHYNTVHPEYNFEIELIVEQDAFEFYEKIFETWKKDFPNILRITPQEQLLDNFSSKNPLIENCRYLEKDSCSAWALWLSLCDKDREKITMHIDPDVFAAYHPGFMKNFKTHSSKALVLGSANRQFVTLGWTLKPTSLVLHKEYLLDDLDDNYWTIFRAYHEYFLKTYTEPLLQALDQRFQSSLISYEMGLRQRAAWYQNHPDHLIGVGSAVSQIVGDDFWLTLNLNGYTSYLLIPQQWIEILPFKKRPKRVRYGELLQLFSSSSADVVLEILLLHEDKGYFEFKQGLWRQVLNDLYDQRIARLTLNEQALLADFF